MRRLILFIVLVFAGGVLAAAPGNPTTATPDDPAYLSVRRLALAAGQSPPSRVSPLSYAELREVLLRVDVDRLPSELVDEYRSTLDMLALDPEPRASGTVGVEVTAEAYLHTSEEYDEWLHWYPDRKPMLSFPFRITALPGLAITADLDWRKNYPFYEEYEGIRETVNPDPLSNIFSDVRETDPQFPFNAFLSAAGDRWSLQYGRSRIGLGLSHTGSLLLSDHVDYHDFLTAEVHGRLAGYRAVYVDLEPWLDGGGTEDERMYMAHRIEVRPAPWLDLTINEAMVFHGKPMELRYLSPLMIMHSWFLPSYANTMINAEAAVRPLPGLEVWAHMAIDQLQSAYEEERGYVDGEPEAMGYLAGVEYVTPLMGARPAPAWLTVGAEWVYLDPWMYIHKGVGMGSFTYRRRVQAENALPAGAKLIIEKSLGYPAGPDYHGITGYATLHLGDVATVALDLSFHAQGENDVHRVLPPDDADDGARETPSGDAPEYVAAGRLTGDGILWRTMLGRVPIEVTAGAVFDVVRIYNNDHVSGALLWDVQFSPYLSVNTVFGN